MYKLIIFVLSASLCLSVVICDLNKDEGAECVWNIPGEGEFKGTCVNSRRCFTTLDKRGDKPPVCSTKGDVTIVCCTDCQLVNDTRNAIVSPKGGVLWKDGRKFRDHCLDYLNDLPNKCPGYYGGIARYLVDGQKCHTYSLWGVGGPPAVGEEPPSVNPYEALIGFGDSVETAQWKTSGAILSDKFILTSGFDAAHNDGLSPKFVAVGVKHAKGRGKPWQTLAVKTVHTHPQYDARNRYHYVALLELEQPISFNRNVFPACLPDPLAQFDVTKAKYTPFADPARDGTVFEESRQTVEVSLLSAESCAQRLSSAEFSAAFPDGLRHSQICYGDAVCQASLPNTTSKKAEENIVGTWSLGPHHKTMAPGTPIVVSSHLDRCVNTVLGVRVSGPTCSLGVFASTQDLLPWIEDTVWP